MFVYFSFASFSGEMGRQKIVNQIVIGIPQI
jgi:hypothetical protein